MNFVQPIRDPALIEKIEKYLKSKNERDYILFLLGIYTGLRISDILSLKVKDLRNKDFLKISERKTKRKKYNSRTIELNPILKKVLKYYLKDKPSDQYVIKSRVGENSPISRERAYMILKDVANKFDIDSLGTHSMRKTLGYHVYQQKKDVVLVQKMLNHESPSHTLRYIGIEQDMVNSVLGSFKY